MWCRNNLCAPSQLKTKTTVQVSHIIRPNRHDESRLWPPHISMAGVEDGSGLDITPEDSEDELETLRESCGSDLTWRRLQSCRSEDDGAGVGDNTQQHLQPQSSNASGGGVRDRLHDPALAKSWIRLESAPCVHFKQQGGATGGKDKWHDWLQMQKDWLSKVEQDPDNYFDDNL